MRWKKNLNPQHPASSPSGRRGEKNTFIKVSSPSRRRDLGMRSSSKKDFEFNNTIYSSSVEAFISIVNIIRQL